MLRLEKATSLFHRNTVTHPGIPFHHGAAKLAALGRACLRAVKAGACPDLTRVAVVEGYVERGRRWDARTHSAGFEGNGCIAIKSGTW